MDVIKTADHVIDLGPEGGHAGGQVVVTGTPEDVARVQGVAHGAVSQAAPQDANRVGRGISWCNLALGLRRNVRPFTLDERSGGTSMARMNDSSAARQSVGTATMILLFACVTGRSLSGQSQARANGVTTPAAPTARDSSPRRKSTRRTSTSFRSRGRTRQARPTSIRSSCAASSTASARTARSWRSTPPRARRSGRTRASRVSTGAA